MNKHKLLWTLLFVLIVVFPLSHALETPTLPLSLYGQININNTPAPPGTLIETYDSRGNLCGGFNIQTTGRFGLLTCMGFNTTGTAHGGNEGEIVLVRVNSEPATVLFGDNASTARLINWKEDTFKNITIVVPPLICGDGFCDLYENCRSCPQDCGICPEDRPTQPTGGDGTGSGDGVGAPIMGPPDFSAIRPLPEEFVEECVESWSCGPWSVCTPDNLEYRECVDLNECGTDFEEPETQRDCIYIDDNETVVDRPPPRPREEFPTIITTCEQRMPFTSIHSISFILLTIILVTSKLSIRYFALRKLKKDKKLEDIKKLEKEYTIKRKSFIFNTTVLVLALIIYVYHYFFFYCIDIYYGHLWLLALFVFLSPIAIYMILELFKYSEKAMRRKIKLLNDTHYAHVLGLVKVVNSQLVDSETEISNMLYKLDRSKEFNDLLSKTDSLKKVYADIEKLYKLYKEEKPATSVEKDLLENISKFEVDEEFKEQAKKYPEIDKLRNRLASLYKAYEHKQELYDELIKIEEEYELGEEKSDE